MLDSMRTTGLRFVAVLASLVLLGVLTGCGDSPEDTIENPIDHPRTARSFLFGVRGVSGEKGQFVAMTTRSDVLAALEAELMRPEAERTLHVHGPIERGDGGHNAPWSWHFVPEDWRMVEISIELCDGTPELVEEDVDYWVDDVGQFCPWGSYVLREL
jgi:hypothetical protein